MTKATRVVSEVAIDELEVGQPLAFDLLDPAGRVLLKSGYVLTQRVVDRWNSYGFAKVLVDKPEAPAALPKLSSQTTGLASGSAIEPTSMQVAASYDPRVLEQIETYAAAAKDRLSDIVSHLVTDTQLQATGLHSIFTSLSQAIEGDSDAVLFRASDENAKLSASSNNALVSRSLLMSTIGATTAAHLGLSVDDCTTVAIAGLMHDVSLFDETLNLFFRDIETADERQNVLNRHSQLSAQLLEHCPGISEQVRLIIMQVHEQIDGSGFPHRILGHHLSAPSRILNLVDAYLTLTDPNQRESYLPADALAYLAGRTGAHAFDYDCMKALLKALSVYSIGSRVVLDNDEQATVVRSSKSDPMSPVVRIDRAESIIDLRESRLAIRAPLVDPGLANRRRLTRSELERVLWKPRYYRPMASA